MRILFAALKHDYGIPERGYSFEYYNFYDSLVGMGHQVEYFDFLPLWKAHGSEGMTRLLRARVDETRPELLFVFLFGDQFDPVQLRRITTETRTITFNWFADDHWRFEDFSRHWAPCFSFVSTTDVRALPRYQSIGYRHALLTQWGANPRLYRKGDGKLRHEVTFVGQRYGDRQPVVRALQRAGVPIQWWGSGWTVRPWHRALRKLRLMSADRLQQVADRRRLPQEEIIAVFGSSRINLNLSASSQPGAEQIKGRNFEIPACGGFQLTGQAERLEEFFALDREIVCYRTTGELIDKVKHYLAHEDERRAIAEAGWLRVQRDHGYEQRFRALFQAMGLA